MTLLLFNEMLNNLTNKKEGAKQNKQSDMKTIEELLLELPLEYRMLALTVRKKRESVHATAKYAQDHAQAVLKGFIWKNTPQGVIFWARVYDALRSKTILPTVIDPTSNLVRPYEKESLSSSQKELQIIERLCAGEEIPAVGDVVNMHIHVKKLRLHGMDVRSKHIADPRYLKRRFKKVYYLHIEE